MVALQVFWCDARAFKHEFQGQKSQGPGSKMSRFDLKELPGYIPVRHCLLVRLVDTRLREELESAIGVAAKALSPRIPTLHNAY